MRARVMRALVLSLPVIAGGAAICIGLARSDWPPGFWRDSGSFIVGCIFAAGIVPAVQTFISEQGEKKRRQQLERDEHLRSTLAPSLVVAARECGAPWDATGVQVFLVTGYFWRKRQVRAVKVRLASIPPSGVTWTPGKGIIGACWRAKAPQVVHLDEPPFSRLADKSEHAWTEDDTRTAFGLSYADYQALGRKYGTVAAVPIMSSTDRYIGCVALDTPPGARLTSVDRVIESLSTTADVVRRLLGR